MRDPDRGPGILISETHQELCGDDDARLPDRGPQLAQSGQDLLVHTVAPTQPRVIAEEPYLVDMHDRMRAGFQPRALPHDIGDILRESLEQESTTLAAYYELLKISEGNSVALEEYAREMILLEEVHLDEVNKMLRKPGEIEPFKE